MKFPTLVYKSPGTHPGVGGTYDYRPAQDLEALEAAIADGWFPTPELAIEFATQPPDVFSWLEYGEAQGWFPPDEPVEETVEIDDSGEVQSPADGDDKDEGETVPVSRETLEAEAKRLGVPFNSRTTDETLNERIQAAQAKPE